MEKKNEEKRKKLSQDINLVIENLYEELKQDDGSYPFIYELDRAKDNGLKLSSNTFLKDLDGFHFSNTVIAELRKMGHSDIEIVSALKFLQDKHNYSLLTSSYVTRKSKELFPLCDSEGAIYFFYDIAEAGLTEMVTSIYKTGGAEKTKKLFDTYNKCKDFLPIKFIVKNFDKDEIINNAYKQTKFDKMYPVNNNYDNTEDTPRKPRR